MTRWLAFPFDSAGYTYDLETLRANWSLLHAGDAEPLPASDEVLAAWALFHAGKFEHAAQAGLAAGAAGVSVSNAAQLVYAHYLEDDERAKEALLMQAVERAEAQAAADPSLASAHYQMGYGLGRYAQGIPVAKALAQNLLQRVKTAFESAIALEPRHADAHFGLGELHAEVIDKLGFLFGWSQGARRHVGIALFGSVMRLHSASVAGKISYASGLLMLDGRLQMPAATALCQAAAACVPRDARERLDVEIAKVALLD